MLCRSPLRSTKQLWPTEAWTGDLWEWLISLWHQDVASDPLGPLSCGPGPPRIGLVLVHNTDAWSDWDPGSLHHQCPGLFIVFLKHCWASRCHLGVLGVRLQIFLKWLVYVKVTSTRIPEFKISQQKLHCKEEITAIHCTCVILIFWLTGIDVMWCYHLIPQSIL